MRTRTRNFIANIRAIYRWLCPGVPLQDDLDPLTRSEFLDLLKTVFAAITFVSVLIAAFTFSSQVRSSSKEYAWRHKKEAQDILKIWDERTSAQKAAIESYFRERHKWDRMYAITREDARNSTRPKDGNGSSG
jgi:hypothetical protein